VIARDVPMRSIRKSSFRGLVEYLLNPQKKLERVGAHAVTNCHSDDPRVAVLEVLNVQAQNKRALSDKTYHFFFSFPHGEEPPAEVLKVLEARLCDAIGFADHQRVSVLHRDTDALHVHVAINKVHPVTKRMHTPFHVRDVLFPRECEALERKYGLQITNHRPGGRTARGGAADMERHAGVESLITWIRRECLPALSEAKSWEQLRSVLESRGLELRLRGAGMVFLDKATGRAVKASSVDRKLGFNQMRKRLGASHGMEATEERDVQETGRPMEPVEIPSHVATVRGAGQPATSDGEIQSESIGDDGREVRGRQPEDHDSADGRERRGSRYRERPVLRRPDSAALYARYLVARERSAGVRTERLLAAKQRMQVRRAAAKRAAGWRRAALRLMLPKGAARIARALVISQARRALQAEMHAAWRAYQAERKRIYEDTGRVQWLDWLRVQAQQGDREAVEVLRLRVRCGGQALAPGIAPPRGGARRHDAEHFQDSRLDSVTKNGTMIYRMVGGAIRTTADQVQVFAGGDDDVVAQALELGRQEYGEILRIVGDEAFRKQVARVAGTRAMQVRFDDASLEAERTSRAPQEDQDGRSRRHGDIGRGARQQNRGGGQDDEEVARAAAQAVARKPDASIAADRPAALRGRRMHEVPARDVARDKRRGHQLLSNDVSGRLVDRNAGGDLDVRWASGRPAGGGTRLAPVEQYVAERNEKLARGIAVLRHRPFDGAAGPATYAGQRVVDGAALVLLQRGREMLVMPVDHARANELRSLAVGTGVDVRSDGAVRRGGRSR
jgi:hypothetical protein